MRRLRFLPVLLVVLLSACTDKLKQPDPDQCTQTGTVLINLNSDLAPATKADEEINVDDFWIEIFNSAKTRLYCQRYSSAKEATIKLNVGDYQLLARHGDSLGVGFSKPFYMARENFTVHGQATETVSATAVLSNVKAAVDFGVNLPAYYQDGYYAIVRHNELKNKKLKFNSNETRAGYIPAGGIVLEVYAVIDGQWRYYASEPLECMPRDFVTFRIEAAAMQGELTVSVLIDGEVDTYEKTIGIASSAIISEPPQIFVQDFDEDGGYILLSGAGAPALSYIAKSGVASAVLEIESEALAHAGLPTIIDLAAMTSSQQEAVDNAGLFSAKSETAGLVEFIGIESGLLAGGHCTTLNTEVASFTLTVTDLKGQSVSQTVSFNTPDAAGNFVVYESDAWARRLRNPRVTISRGNPELFSLQYRQLGSEQWTDAPAPVSGVYPDITGLTPSTTYEARLIYVGSYLLGEVQTFTTEDELQVGNPGLEEWTTLQFNNANSGKVSNVDWYVPYQNAADAWWAVNSMKTMLSFNRILGLGPEQYTAWKTAPTVFIDDSPASGYRAAKICSVGVGTTSNALGFAGTRAIARGELFIGTADNNGNHTSEGYAFPSRPSAMSVSHRFEEYDGESYEIIVNIYDNSNNLIGQGSASSSQGVASWTRLDIPIDYSILDKKAAKIYIMFASSTKSSPSTRKPTQVSDGEHCIGTALHIDDVTLIYE